MMRRIQADASILERTLTPSMFKDSTQLYEKVGKDLNVKSVTMDDLLLWARKNKIEVPTEEVELREPMMELRIPWNKISKIGDVVLLKQRIETLSDDQLRLESNDLPSTRVLV
jgi:sporulation protein YlmC with PRC-barrel domain